MQSATPTLLLLILFMLDSLLVLRPELPSRTPKIHPHFSRPTIKHPRRPSQDRMLMALNSVSLDLSAEKALSHTIVLPSSKFNNFIKLIQVERREIKPQKPHRPVLNLNDQCKLAESKEPSLAAYKRRVHTKRVKTEPNLPEEKWNTMKKRVQAGQLTIKFPQIALVKDSLKIAETATPTSKASSTKIKFKSRSFVRERKGGLGTGVQVQHTEPLENIDIAGWTLNQF